METLFYILCTTLPSHLITFFQYWDYKWRSKKLAFLFICINMTAKFAVLYWAVQSGGNIRVVELFFSALAALIYAFFIQASIFKLLFSYVLILDYLVVIRGIASFFSIRLFAASSQSWQSSLMCLVVCALTLPGMLLFFRKSARQIQQTDAPALWRVIWTAPTLTSVIVLIYTSAYEETSAGAWLTLLTRFILLACILVVYFILLQSLGGIQRRAALEEQARQTKNILALQRTQYANLQTYMEEIRRARHDLRQHQKIIQSFLDSGDESSLREYLRSQNADLPPDAIRRYCANHPINMLLNFYAGQFMNQNIDFEFQIDLPQKAPISEPDLCVVIGNLLENAQDACRNQEEPFIRAAAKCAATQAVVIIVDNTSPVPPRIGEDGAFVSSKPNGSGIGTQSVRYIAKQYGGTTDFRWDSGMFCASVFLNPPSFENDDPPSFS